MSPEVWVPNRPIQMWEIGVCPGAGPRVKLHFFLDALYFLNPTRYERLSRMRTAYRRRRR